jgi:hypothetical protein
VSAPMLDRQCAAAVLALVAAAKAHAPGHELAWLTGWAMRASGEPVGQLVAPGLLDPRREPDEPQGAPIGRVELKHR